MMSRCILLTLVALQLLSFTDAASQVAVSSFQAAPVTLGALCQATYNGAITGCSTDDFLATTTCSSNCRTGLTQVQLLLNLRCGGIVVADSTLLGRIFNGQILAALCPTRSSTTSTGPTAVSLSTKPVTLKSSSTTRAAESTKATSTTTTTAALSGTSQSSRAAATTATSATTAVSSSVISSQSSTESIVQESTSILTTPGRSVTTATSQAVAGPTQLSVQQKQVAAMANSGGGSPFDIIVSSGAEKLMAGWTMIFSFVWVAWVIGG